MKDEFQDTIKFSLVAGLEESSIDAVISRVLEIKGVFAVAAADKDGFYFVKYDRDEDQVMIGRQIAQMNLVYATHITPKQWYETAAKYGLAQP